MTDFNTTFKDLLENSLLKETTATPEPNILAIGNGVNELTISNLYAYFLDPNPKEPHGLGSLFLDALLELIGSDAKFNLNDTKVYREINHQGKYIDIVIKDHTNLILIENKLFADVYNDFIVYESFDAQKIGTYLILSVGKYYNKIGNWKVITHQQLFEIVERKFESLEIKPKGRQKENYETFIEILKKQYLIVENLQEKLSFISENTGKLTKLITILNEIRSTYLTKISEILRATMANKKEDKELVKVTIERKASINFKVVGLDIMGYIFFKEDSTDEVILSFWIASSKDWYAQWHKSESDYGIFNPIVEKYQDKLVAPKERNNGKDWTSMFYKIYKLNHANFEKDFTKSLEEDWKMLIKDLLTLKK